MYQQIIRLTYRIIETSQIHVTLDPVPELHCIVGRIALTVGGQTEDSQRLRNGLQLQELFLLDLVGISVVVVVVVA